MPEACDVSSVGRAREPLVPQDAAVLNALAGPECPNELKVKCAAYSRWFENGWRVLFPELWVCWLPTERLPQESHRRARRGKERDPPALFSGSSVGGLQKSLVVELWLPCQGSG